MLVDEIWDFKSLNMGRELEIAGEFIYDSAKEAMSIRGLNNTYEINIILYTGAVGIERLQKISFAWWRRIQQMLVPCQSA
jgi:hypothetical protein